MLKNKDRNRGAYNGKTSKRLFLEFLQNDKKVSDNTLQSYRRDIVYYNKYLDENKINYTKVKEADIKEYLNHLQEVGKKAYNSIKI